MPLITAPGAANADSYATVAAADAHHAAFGASDWAAATVAQRESALRRATQWIDGRYRSRFPGVPADPRVQALEWPRTSAADVYGHAIGSTEVPREIVAATCEAALREIQVPFSLTPDFVAGGQIKREKIGELETEYAFPANIASVKPTLSSVEEILSRLLSRPANASFLLRA